MAIPRPLFVKEHLARYLDRLYANARQRLMSMAPDRLLATPEPDLVEGLLEGGVPECPTLRREDAYLLEPGEADIEVREFGEITTRRVTQYTLAVPFDGAPMVFDLTPGTWMTTVPCADVDGAELRVVHQGNGATAPLVKANLDRQLDAVDRYLSWSRQDIETHRRRLDSDIRTWVASRRAKLLADREVHANIGYPIKPRPDASAHAVPLRRRQVRTRPRGGSETSVEPFKPEPALLDADYEAALAVLRNARNGLERSPSTSRKLGEEEIRDLLLVSLNAHFEGQAAGEVFNGAGKTDILIRVQDRNVFIGECKIWKGPKTVTDMLDQLLSYLVWRDTKAALLLFIRDANVSTVTAKAVAKIEEHPAYKRGGKVTTEERYDFVLTTPGDPLREIHLALLPFLITGKKDRNNDT
jgi:hypothetical protein